MTTRRKLLWTALLLWATCYAVAVAAFVRPYVVAKYRGERADLSGAFLVRAPLVGAWLIGADLQGVG